MGLVRLRSLLDTSRRPPYTGSVVLLQSISNLLSGKKYTITVYQGRQSAAYWSNNPYFRVDILGQPNSGTQVTVCGDPNNRCTLKGNSAKWDPSYWQKVEVPFTATASLLTLNITTVWTDTRDMPAPVLFDAISITPAS